MPIPVDRAAQQVRFAAGFLLFVGLPAIFGCQKQESLAEREANYQAALQIVSREKEELEHAESLLESKQEFVTIQKNRWSKHLDQVKGEKNAKGVADSERALEILRSVETVELPTLEKSVGEHRQRFERAKAILKEADGELMGPMMQQR